MKNFKNSHVVIFVVIVLFLIGLITFAIALMSTYPQGYQMTETEEKNSNTSTTTSSNSNSGESAESSSVTQTLSYSDAVKIYANKTLQFDSNCLVNPSYLTLKEGTSIMLDNRANLQRAVYLDSVQYNIAPYGFKIATLTTNAPLPHTIQVDCGNGKNNGRILLQQ